MLYMSISDVTRQVHTEHYSAEITAGKYDIWLMKITRKHNLLVKDNVYYLCPCGDTMFL